MRGHQLPAEAAVVEELRSLVPGLGQPLQRGREGGAGVGLPLPPPRALHTYYLPLRTVLSTAPHGGGVQEGGGHGGVGEGHPLQLLGHGGGHGDTCAEQLLNKATNWCCALFYYYTA